MQSPVSILQQYWGYSSFRPMQEEIINAVLQKKDLLALLPTGGGKSICFQIPALMTEGMCLVISPLIALMKDQVSNLQKKGIPATAIYSGLTQFDTLHIFQEAAKGVYKFLYVSPERLETDLFLEYLQEFNINLIAVDEAHCISQWGYDFRPPYLRIASLRDQLPDTPVIALTASATPLVQKDIIQKLHFKNFEVFRQSFEKPNLSFSVFRVDSKINKVAEILAKVPGSGIIYCNTRRKTKDVAELLRMQGIIADHYNAGLSQEERNEKQESWLHNKIRVMVCTNAFGMGIDKPDVRTVIHYDSPDCIESYYQEAGRAGRDSLKAYAILLYQDKDIDDLLNLPEIKFPAIETIKDVYQSIADYLNIPIGIGSGNYYDFDLIEFSQNFKLIPKLVLNVIKVLEQEGHISFNESIFLPSQICFEASKETLYALEQSHPHLDEVAKCLLRTYEGIFDNYVSVYERQIARLCRLDVSEVIKWLTQLQAYGVISYRKQKETPQLYFKLDRAPAKYLHIDHTNYLQRKDIYIEKINAINNYIQLRHDCRSRFITAYFGESEVSDCKICDICLQKKSSDLNATEFTIISAEILSLLQSKPMSFKELLQQFETKKKEDIQQIISYLQLEQKIKMDDWGTLYIN